MNLLQTQNSMMIPQFQKKTEPITEINDNNLTPKEIHHEDSEDNNATSQYDIILQVKPEKIPEIKSQIIDGQKCIVIPINDSEQATVNV